MQSFFGVNRTSDLSRIFRLVKEGIWIILGQILMVLGFLVGVRLLTGIMSPEAYGELSLGITLATLVNQTLLGPLGGGIMRFYAPAVEDGDIKGYLHSTGKLTLNTIGIILLLTLISILCLSLSGQGKWILITIAASLFAIFSGVNSILMGIQSAARQRAIVAIHQGLDPWLRFLVAAGLLFLTYKTSSVALLGYAFATALILISQAFFFRETIAKTHVNRRKEKVWTEDIWRFSLPIGVFGMFTWAQMASDRWALQIFSSTEEVGKYAVVYQLGFYPIALLSGLALQFFIPILYQRVGNADDEARKKNATQLCWRITWITMALTFVAFVVAIFGHELIFKIFVNENYREVSFLLPWIVLGGGLFACGQALASDLMAKLMNHKMMAVKISTAILGLICNFIGAYLYGVSGVVGAGLLFSIVYFTWMAFLVNEWGMRNVYHKKTY
jgi:O-antigen/teichoic acid export membrane protein